MSMNTDELLDITPMVDDDNIDYISEIDSDTWSLDSATSRFRWEYGRRYNDSPLGEYLVPNDEKQLNQLDITHHMFLVALEGKLFLAPIDETPHRVLDIGTGSGIWAMDFADQYPMAQVIGTDISPTMPTSVPPNCTFEIDDACADWSFTLSSFNFIRCRMLYGSIDDWPAYYRRVLTTLCPGGWFEQTELSIKFRSDDGTLRPHNALYRWGEHAVVAGKSMGRTFEVVDNMRTWIEAAGFDNVHERAFKLPIGPWGQEPMMGKWCQAHYEEGVEGWVLGLYTKYLQWSLEDVWDLIKQIKLELRDTSLHTYIDMKVVWAQKPYEGDEDV